MQERVVRVGLVQMSSGEQLQENRLRALELMQVAAEQGCDVICLSELFLYWGANKKDGLVEMADLVEFQGWARKNQVNLVLGSVLLAGEKPTNTCFVINHAGEIICRYDKRYMYTVRRGDLTVDEGESVQAGKEFGICEVDGVKIGVGICFDLRFPEYFRELIRRGAEVIFLPAHFRLNTGGLAWDVLSRARAIENQVYFCACGQAGVGLCGNSRVVGYDGEIVAELGRDEEGVLVTDLDLEALRRFRREFPVLEQA